MASGGSMEDSAGRTAEVAEGFARDDAALARLGKKAVLKRNFGNLGGGPRVGNPYPLPLSCQKARECVANNMTASFYPDYKSRYIPLSSATIAIVDLKGQWGTIWYPLWVHCRLDRHAFCFRHTV